MPDSPAIRGQIVRREACVSRAIPVQTLVGSGSSQLNGSLFDQEGCDQSRSSGNKYRWNPLTLSSAGLAPVTVLISFPLE